MQLHVKSVFSRLFMFKLGNIGEKANEISYFLQMLRSDKKTLRRPTPLLTFCHLHTYTHLSRIGVF